jgi:hypothetical protein
MEAYGIDGLWHYIYANLSMWNEPHFDEKRSNKHIVVYTNNYVYDYNL